MHGIKATDYFQFNADETGVFQMCRAGANNKSQNTVSAKY
jgi:hypothetical protein